MPAKNTKKIDENWWHQIILPNNQIGWIQDNGYKKFLSIRKTMKITCEKLLGIPYVWGGRSSFGFDCSGFVQTIFKFCGYILPRDSKDQFNTDKMVSIINKDSQVGDLLFFSKNNKIHHVGISLENDTFIHSSGYVKYNSLNPNDKNFDKNLANMYHSTLSIKQLIQE